MQKPSSLLAAAGRAGTLGLAAGLRSQIPLAMLARSAEQSGPAILRKRGIRGALYLAAAGELVGDKLPVTPIRIKPGPLSGRLMFGALSGAILSRRLGSPVVAGVLVGAAGALAGSFIGFHARSWLGHSSAVPDPVWAVGEDALAIALGILATRQYGMT